MRVLRASLPITAVAVIALAKSPTLGRHSRSEPPTQGENDTDGIRVEIEAEVEIDGSGTERVGPR